MTLLETTAWALFWCSSLIAADCLLDFAMPAASVIYSPVIADCRPDVAVLPFVTVEGR